MRTLYVEVLATRDGPEPCVGCPEGGGEVAPLGIRRGERDEHAVVTHASAPAAAPAIPADKDDPYKDFVVPDDLVW